MSENKTIEEYLKDLREINRQLQKDDVRMDDALELYQRGAVLAKQAHALLDDYEKKIDEIESGALPGGGR